ncbi:hypothetical protein AOQ71_32895 [Bradyrhizobium manausense]|uniref:Uncharacterized protein n=1 Tax=Bradyrhizobium manausense TaxID=989370 RepID=A0A0R3D4M1_9BRAD|nr:hypothetical protein AOQ71_32895 [Bradyrhizobium manausense]
MSAVGVARSEVIEERPSVESPSFARLLAGGSAVLVQFNQADEISEQIELGLESAEPFVCTRSLDAFIPSFPYRHQRRFP